MALLKQDEVEARLAELDGWSLDGKAITRTFELRDFMDSVGFVNRLAQPAEEMGHHPDLEISWDKVGVSITDHHEGGLTEADFELAKKIQALA